MSQKILIMNMTRMGDLIQSTPVISGLNEKYPEARITLLVTSDFSEFAARIPHVDEIKVLNLRQFIDEFKDKTKKITVYLKVFKNTTALKKSNELIFTPQ